MRLIDANTLKAEFTGNFNGGYYTVSEIHALIDTAPTIDAAPVKHGKWEEPQWVGIMVYDKRAYAQCSVCKEKSYLGWHDNYCRFCGAKMEG